MTSFMWIEGVTSGSPSQTGPDWIVVDQYSFALSRTESVQASGADSTTKKKPLINLASIEKEADAHTAKLARWHVDHKDRVAKKVVIVECNAGFEPHLRVEFQNALLVGYKLRADTSLGASDSDETLSIEFTKIEFKFRATNAESAFEPFRTFLFDDAT